MALVSFFFSLAKTQRPACGRQAQRNLCANGYCFSTLTSCFLSLGSCLSVGRQVSCLLVLVSFLARKDAKTQRNLCANGSSFLALSSWLSFLSSFRSQRRRDAKKSNCERLLFLGSWLLSLVSCLLLLDSHLCTWYLVQLINQIDTN
jgi:hypothetical protein